MSFDGERLLQLLPALYRIRDLQVAGVTGAARGPLETLLHALGEQLAVLEEDIAQLGDDAFIELCAPWVVPYIGDLIGYRTLHGAAPKVQSRRAEVAHTIAFRRRKGTAAMLEQLARDVTGWNARAVEMFQLLATSQHVNHVRPFNHFGPDVRDWEPLQRLGTAFETTGRTVEVRNVDRGGRYNVPNVGLFLWRLDAHPVTNAPAVKVDDRRYLFDPRGIGVQLVTLPESEDEIAHIAEPLNVPDALSRRVLSRDLALYYGAGKSLRVFTDGAPVPIADVLICNLDDNGATWAHLPPAGKIAVDPALGRLALPPTPPVRTNVRVTFHHAFGAELGGGEYPRQDTFEAAPTDLVVRVPDDQATITAALAALGGAGVVEITDNGRYVETPVIAAAANARIELRAAPGKRPTLVLGGAMKVSGAAESEAVLNGLLVLGGPITVAAGGGNRLRRLALTHLTLVPGRVLKADGAPLSPGAASVVVSLSGVAVQLARTITGPIFTNAGGTLAAKDAIVDAGSDEAIALAAPDGKSPGSALTLEEVTVVGRVETQRLPLVSNSILLGRAPAATPKLPPVRAAHKQDGCVRFSFVPLGSQVPRRHRCQPAEDGPASVGPRFVSLRYGAPAYAQLSTTTPPEIGRGADDDGEMGAYHHLQRPQRESDLRVRLDEYLRVGLRAGLFHET